MTPFSHIILQQHRTRKTPKQKTAFLSLLQSHFPTIPITKGSRRQQTIILGDIESAKIIFAARYDTSAKPSLWGHMDNTAGVIILSELLTILNANHLKKAAFLFYSGKPNLKNEFQNKQLILFNCPPVGNHIMVSADKMSRSAYGDLLKKAFLPTEEKTILFEHAESTRHHRKCSGFKQTITITTLKRRKVFGYESHRIRTPKDTYFDRSNITLICNSMLYFLKHI